MSSSSRILRRSVFSFLWLISGACAAQILQFANVPKVQLTDGRVSSF